MPSRIIFFIIIIFFLSHPAFLRSQDIPDIIFKERKIELSESELEKNIVMKSSIINENYKNAVLPPWKKKIGNAAIESLIWSPNSKYLSFRISQLFTGDTDAIWCLNVTNKTYYPVTKDFQRDSVWMPKFQSPYNAWTLDNKIYVRVQHYKRTKSYDSYCARFFYNPADSSYDITKSIHNETLPDTLSISQRISPIDNSLNQELTVSSELISILESYTFEEISISPNNKFIIAEQPTYHNDPGPLFVIEFKNNKAYRTNFIVQKFDMGTAEIQRWDSTGNVYCKSIYGVLHFIDLDSRTDYSLTSASYHLLGGIVSPNNKYIAILFEGKKDSEDFVSVISTKLFSFIK